MREISNKLFQDLKLKNAEIIKVVGGISTNTSVSTDTNVSNGSYDIALESKGKDEEVLDISSVVTGTSDKDKPETTKLQNNSIH